MKRVSWVSGLVLFFLAAHYVAAAPLDAWHWRNPLFQGNNLNSIAFGNGRLVALGEGGTVVVSTNGGTNWQTHIRLDATGFPIWMRQIAFGNGLFVGADWNVLSTSTNGVDWTPQNFYLGDVASLNFCDGKFIAVSGARVSTSTNGVNWSSQVMPVPPGSRMEGSAAGNGTTIVVGYGGVIAATTNGVDWLPVNSGTNTWLTSATFDGQRFLVTGWDGTLLVSTNGLNWSNWSFPGSYLPYFLSAVSYNGRTVLAGQTFAVVENNSKTILPVAFDYIYVEDVIVADGVFWAVGEGGAIRRSTNGYDWVEITSRVPGVSTLSELSGVAFDGRKFLAVGFGDFITSSNGVNWTRTNAPVYLGVNDVAWGNGRFVVAGFDYSHPLTEPLASSADGTNWVVHSLPLGSFGQFLQLKFLNGHFIAVGSEGAVAISTNGMDWSVSSLGSNLWLQAVGYGEGKYLIGGMDGSLYTSSNAVTWKSNYVETVHQFVDFAYGRGRFVAAAYRGSPEGLAWSPDGLNWTWQPGHAQRIVYEHGVFVAAGASRISTSFNGKEFTVRNAMCNQSPGGIAFGKGTFVIVGNDAAILQSGPIPPAFELAVKQDGSPIGPLLRLDSPVDGIYDLQQSSNSIDWTTWATTYSSNGTFEVRAKMPSEPRFYRAILRP